ncbi:succinate dehydrogenase/fumarate reductase flavoprotein subunit [Desulfitobacterium dichloroeliminans LMG P-21439]|uniref:Succinate dehydrogenase/fumarate reductase flavoprotein subunit n=1 Tax=Desulfitobacterium dichloroeliminans (strain LMG P-21439 / DCA1) TaxID=871963 RepID=L0F8M7_DESDL|nr:FAD-dependent oxidoreductase [Desulfitobacterium dichloroeliminans]AGA68996.1 succinate dehydrogenase/fumarate reductase flavoprotein subunit [Desulfitobacterium dichloroeliminans LMG P-21439]
MVETNKQIRECEVLVVGGGIAGLMAAIAAADNGAKVILADKADSRRSGSGATGNDHFVCYIPEVHGAPEGFLAEYQQSMVGGNADVSIQMKFIKRTFECVKDWHKWGIDMRPHDEWEFNGHAFPGRMRIFLKYNGENQKGVLTEQALKRGVIIENKTPITEFLTNENGKIIGAIGVDISKLEPEIKLFKADSVISATGQAVRLYPSITGGMMCNTAFSPANAGTGRAAAYRVGAKLVNLEIPNTHAGPKYFERAGKATWIGVLKDSSGKPVGPFVTKPTKEYGDITADVWHSVFTEKNQNGTGPVFMDCSETAPKDMEYMMWGLKCEGDTSLIDAMEKQGIDLGKSMVEFTKYKPFLIGRGIQIDENGSTNVDGLYAAGDEVGNFRCDIAGAAVMGRIAGEHASARSKGQIVSYDIENHPTVKKAQEFYTKLMTREEGSPWKELNMAVQQIMDDYAGVTFVRSETLLSSGLEYLRQLESNAKNSMTCKDSHELMRALESFDLLLVGKLVMKTAMERKETRGMHKRSDYTFTNPLLNGMFITIQNENGSSKLEWRKSY